MDRCLQASTGRVCAGMEVDPVYCDVAVARWEAFTVWQARLAEDDGGTGL